MGQMREGQKLSRAVKDFIKHRIFGIVGLMWGASIEEDLLPIRVYRLPLWNLKILPYSFPCQHASPIHLKHTRRVGFGR
jgi:hypothetical protein